MTVDKDLTALVAWARSQGWQVRQDRKGYTRFYDPEAGSFDQAMEQFRAGLGLDPQSVEGHYNLGAVYFEQRRYDEAIRARIKSYELAFQMQRAVPEAVDLATESAATHQLYGLGQKETQTVGRQLVVARRLVERGVRFVQVFHGSNGGAGAWDAHSDLKAGHTRLAKEIDQLAIDKGGHA